MKTKTSTSTPRVSVQSPKEEWILVNLGVGGISPHYTCDPLIFKLLKRASGKWFDSLVTYTSSVPNISTSSCPETRILGKFRVSY